MSNRHGLDLRVRQQDVRQDSLAAAEEEEMGAVAVVVPAMVPALHM